MKIFLAGEAYLEKIIRRIGCDFYRLETFYSISKGRIEFIPKYKDFLLDSGAFTFMNSTHKSVEWDSYIERYAHFITTHNIKNFFELDIDSLVGIKEVERLRTRLETLVGRQCIPVWHKSRGYDYWKRTVREYPYAAIGGLVMKEITSEQYKYFPIFLQEARKTNCKVHALGFTSLSEIRQYPFYSVDSSSWTFGNRVGQIYSFANNTLSIVKKKPGEKVRIQSELAEHNLKEWIKFLEYADKYL